tara:strand:+ start:717 stop:1004 length:288 start_codon:yes stop_codon:yes gene_type:complete
MKITKSQLKKIIVEVLKEAEQYDIEPVAEPVGPRDPKQEVEERINNEFPHPDENRIVQNVVFQGINPRYAWPRLSENSNLKLMVLLYDLLEGNIK